MVQCDDCKGKGYKVFLGQVSDCNVCKGAGEIAVCSSFALPPGAVMAFRNQKCHNCGVRENNHNVAEVNA